MRKILLFIFMIFIVSFCLAQTPQEKQEILKTEWPDDYNWKVITDQEDANIHFVEIIPDNESEDNWTILGTMMSLKNIQGLSLDMIINMYKEKSVKESSNSIFTVIEKNTSKNWVLFKIETEKYPNDDKPESQLFRALISSKAVYINFVAVKEPKLSETFIAKWSVVFKKFELIQR